MMRRLSRAWPPSRIGLRLLAFNLLVVFVPVIGVLYLDVYETQLLQAQEGQMVLQGRLIAGATASPNGLDVDRFTTLIRSLGRQSDARVRLYDAAGLLIADSARIVAPPSASYAYPSAPASDTRSHFLYRVGASIANARQRVSSLLHRLTTGRDEATVPETSDVAPEVRAALEGRYGAATRQTPGQRSLTMFAAVPVREGGTVIGAVVVSQSTFRVLQSVYDVRLRIFQVVIASLFAAAILTTLAAMTIVKPLRRLRRQAAAAAERRGPLPVSFPGSNRKDELGDLARAMEVLTRRLNEQIGQLEGFTADVAHEFRNPLASIRTAAEMAGQSERAEDRDRFLGLMMRDVDRLERLVSGAREMARIDGELEQSGQQAAPLADLLRDAIDRLGPIAHSRISLDGLPADVVVRGSRERLSQVFENLLANAVSLAPPETQVEVAASVDGQQCAVRIADRGPGIPEAHLDRIFERFFTYRPASGRQEHLGLGLAIARRIVESHGGTLTALNREGGGAEFTVSLNYSARSAASASTFSARRDGR